jgi:ABC-2 type transport system ATP-binding protein
MAASDLQIMIRVRDLQKRYRNVEALAGVSFDVAPGELFAYLGPNGSGKTTTVSILTGLKKPSGGKAFLNGCSIENDPVRARTECGLVTQQINLDNELTIAENLEIHGRLFRMGRHERRKRIEELLEYVELSDRRGALVRELSGGMKRRVMIARALMHRPRILFLDEPTVGLDPTIRRRIWSFIKMARTDGTTVFLTTHYIEEAEFLADRVAFLESGRLVALDTPERLMAGFGAWALDEIVNGHIRTAYFKSREEAQALMTQPKDGFTLRRVHLEDAFHALTGKKVQ